MDSTSLLALERLEWRPFSGVGRAAFSLLGVKPGQEVKKKVYSRVLRTGTPNQEP